MGAAAYNRGSKLIRQQIADESKTQITVSKQYITGLESQLSINTELVSTQTAEIQSLKAQLERANMFVKLRAAERDMAYEERDAAIKTCQIWKDRARDFESKHKKCSAILNLIRLYVGREQFEQYHNEAKHDYPHLWPDIERDHAGWPVKHSS